MQKTSTNVLSMVLNGNYDDVIGTPISFTMKGGWSFSVDAMCDTGASMNSIDGALFKKLAKNTTEYVREVSVVSSLGKQVREVYRIDFEIEGLTLSDEFNIADRSGMRTPVLLGMSTLMYDEEE